MRVARTWPLTLRQEAGVPVVPPAFAVRSTARLRGLLAMLNDRLGLPMQIVMERCLGALDAPASARAGGARPSRSHASPGHRRRARDRRGCDADALDRLLSYLASRGCVRRDRRGRYSANRVTRMLTRGGGWAGWVQFLGAPWTMSSYSHLLGAVRDGTDPVVATHGIDFFAYLGRASRSRRRVPRCDGGRRASPGRDDPRVTRLGRAPAPFSTSAAARVH